MSIITTWHNKEPSIPQRKLYNLQHTAMNLQTMDVALEAKLQKKP